MQGSKYFPAVELTRVNDGQCMASAAILVSSILSPLLRKTEENDRHNELADNYRRHLAFLQALTGWPETVTLSLNITTRPDALHHLGGTIETVLAITVAASTEKKAVAEILARHSALNSLLNNFFPDMEFVNVQTREKLHSILHPFTPAVVQAIIRRRENLIISRPQQDEDCDRICHTIGFLASNRSGRNTKKTENTQIPYLFPWIMDDQHDVSIIAEALLLNPSPLWLQVRLRPTKTTRKTCARLTETLYICENLLAAQKETGSVFSVQIKALLDAVTERIQCLGAPVFAGSVFLSSTTGIDEAVTQAVATVISAGPTAIKDTKISLFGGTRTRPVEPDEIKDPFYLPDAEPFTPEEASCMFRLPFPKYSNAPGLPIRDFRTVPAPPEFIKKSSEQGLLFGDNIHRGYGNAIYLSTEDAMRHTCILGQTGSGKSTLLSSLITQAIRAGQGLCLIDPHGDLVEDILHRYPQHRKNDLILVDFLDQNHVVPMNLLNWEDEDDRDFLIDDLYCWLDQIYDMRQTGGPIFELLFRSFLRGLMGIRKETSFVPVISDFSKLFLDQNFREFCKAQQEDEDVARMLEQAERARGDLGLNNVAPYITSKLNRFTMDKNLRRITGQEKMAFDFSDIMNSGKVMLVNLGRGRLGDTVTSLLATQIVGRFKAAAMKRINMDSQQRRDFFLYVDEFQNLASSTFTTLLSEARKFRLGLVLANQYADQLDVKTSAGSDSVLRAILGNVGTIINFRLGIQDAELMEPVFFPEVSKNDLINLPLGHCYVGMKTGRHRPVTFSLQTHYRKTPVKKDYVSELREYSMKKYALTISEADRNIAEHNAKIDRMLKKDAQDSCKLSILSD